MKVIFSKKAEKEFLKLDKQIQKQVQIFILDLAKMDNPKNKGKSLVGNFATLWRYRVGDYRIICDIQDDKILITVVKIGHRKDVYNK